MNVLAAFLRDHPSALRELADGERVSLGRLTAVIQEYDFPFVLDHEVNAALIRGQPLGHVLPDAYLGVVEVEHWNSRLEAADAPQERERKPLGVNEWVTLASTGDSARGLSLPDDDDRANHRISMLAGSGALQRVSIEYPGEPGLPGGLSVSLVHGCSLPDWGECRGDDCSGDCRLERVYNDENGLVCRCPHLEDRADAYLESVGAYAH